MVAVRSTGYSFDAIVGYHHDAGQNIALVDETYLRTLVNVANERFNVNTERIARFHEQYSPKAPSSLHKLDWEDADARKIRKREEGLARQQVLRANNDAAFGGSTPRSPAEG
jgi:tRNA wybutosine-synthesizing protein 3